MEEKSISGAFLECLEKIMELEKRKRVQEKTMDELGREIAPLGISQNYLKPVERKVESDDINAEIKEPLGAIKWGESLFFAPFGAIIGVVVWDYWGRRFNVSICIILSVIISYLLIVFFLKIYDDKTKAKNNNKLNAAQETAHKVYLTQMQQYQNAVAADAERVNYENSKKRTLQELRNQLDRKHDDTDALLGQFYAASGLYQDYTNFVAVTHIYEYLKSGICSKLSGTDGAYMVFKYEMHEKHKEEQLDTLIQKVDELHFDNMILNRSLGEIGSQVERLTDSVDGFRSFYQEASARQEAQLAQTGERLRSLEESYIRNSEITQYNQRCIESELELSNWLEVYRYANNR